MTERVTDLEPIKLPPGLQRQIHVAGLVPRLRIVAVEAIHEGVSRDDVFDVLHQALGLLESEHPRRDRHPSPAHDRALAALDVIDETTAGMDCPMPYMYQQSQPTLADISVHLREALRKLVEQHYETVRAQAERGSMRVHLPVE